VAILIWSSSCFVSNLYIKSKCAISPFIITSLLFSFILTVSPLRISIIAPDLYKTNVLPFFIKGIACFLSTAL
jgi:hypothetical protein